MTATPFAPTEYGTVLPGAPVAPTAASCARFRDVKTYAAGVMPEVKPGQIYDDLDPRAPGRQIQVLKVGGDGKVMVRTITPSTCSRTATPAKDTTGAISFIAQRRFRENSRGFRYVRGSTLRSVHALLLAARLADACDLRLTDAETRAADALIGLLGRTLAHEYLDVLIGETGEAARAVYLGGGIADLLTDALVFADEIEASDQWHATPVASERATRLLAAHT